MNDAVVTLHEIIILQSRHVKDDEGWCVNWCGRWPCATIRLIRAYSALKKKEKEKDTCV